MGKVRAAAAYDALMWPPGLGLKTVELDKAEDGKKNLTKEEDANARIQLFLTRLARSATMMQLRMFDIEMNFKPKDESITETDPDKANELFKLALLGTFCIRRTF